MKWVSWPKKWQLELFVGSALFRCSIKSKFRYVRIHLFHYWLCIHFLAINRRLVIFCQNVFSKRSRANFKLEFIKNILSLDDLLDTSQILVRLEPLNLIQVSHVCEVLLLGNLFIYLFTRVGLV